MLNFTKNTDRKYVFGRWLAADIDALVVRLPCERTLHVTVGACRQGPAMDVANHASLVRALNTLRHHTR